MTQEFKGDVQKGVEVLGKVFQGLLSFGKEVLPKDTAEFLKKAEHPLEDLKSIANTFANAFHEAAEKTKLPPREAAKKKYPLDGESAYKLEQILALTEQNWDRDAKEKDRLRCLILQAVEQAEKDKGSAKTAIQTLKDGLATPS